MEGLSFAINMEVEGEAYYRQQAQKNRGNALEPVFSELADEEIRHAELLRLSEMEQPFAGEDFSSNVFDGLSELKVDVKARPEQIDAYRMALDMEQKSIELYERLLRESGGKSELYEFIIGQEKEHYRVLNEIIRLLSRPENWAESAEFGIREEY
ncbi:MAG: ferritin family protein [Burkholderiales bacterium]